MKALSYFLNLMIYTLLPFLLVFIFSFIASFSYYNAIRNESFYFLYTISILAVACLLLIDYDDNEMYFFKLK